jgi:D-glycero-D-manno-heptose 1,7-bisphosphate phosphatase
MKLNSSPSICNRVVLLDRDGVINHDSTAYIKSCAEFIFLPGSIEAIRYLTVHDFKIIVITNQSAVGRGMISESELNRIFDHMIAAVTDGGGRITDIFHCPHHPEDNCRCRKPETGLIQRAQRKYGFDIDRAWMVGDSTRDIECAKNAGCGRSILVQTGNGPAAQRELRRRCMQPDHIAPDLLAAAHWIVRDFRSSISPS